MSGLWERVLNIFNFIGDNSGCHQIPERCYCIKGYTLPLCARCTGVLLGQITTVILFLFGIRIPLLYGMILLGLMGADWTVQYFGIAISTNRRRTITGYMGGIGLFSIYIYIGIWIFDLITK